MGGVALLKCAKPPQQRALRLVGFEDAAESDAAMALLEHLRESTER